MTVEKLSEEESYPGDSYQRLFDAITDTGGIPLQTEMDEIIRIVHKDFPNTVAPVDNIVESEEKKTDSTGDPLIDKILIEIRGKLVYNEFTRLLKEHLGWHPAELRMTSVKYFVEKGSITGGFFEAIRNIAHQYAAFVLEQPLLNKYKNEVLKSNKQTKEVSNNPLK